MTLLLSPFQRAVKEAHRRALGKLMFGKVGRVDVGRGGRRKKGEGGGGEE